MYRSGNETYSTLAIELERRLKVKVDEFGLLLRHLYGYNSVCFLKQATLSRLPGQLNLVTMNACFNNTRHLTQNKGGSLDERRFFLKNVCFPVKVSHFTIFLSRLKES